MRIHKWLSSEGVVSRRKAEEYIMAGRVTVNDRKAVIGQEVRPGRDIVAVDGVKVESERGRGHRYYIALNKPRGYVSTLTDELGRRCVADLVADVGARVYPIGRLDKDSEGLLLLTNDGEFANMIMHPSREVGKSYRVTVPGPVSEDQLIKLSVGVDIGDHMTAPAQADVLTKEPGRTVLRITLHEGKNRQVRRMCEAVGLEVSRLKRTSIGPLRLGMLKPGSWRELDPAEVGALRAAVKTPNRQSMAAEAEKGSGGKPHVQRNSGKPRARGNGENPPAQGSSGKFRVQKKDAPIKKGAPPRKPDSSGGRGR